MENAHLIVGLGNPGKEYEHTRHNAGFMVVEALASQWGARWSEVKRLQARVARSEPGGRKVLLAEPQTFMNRSGDAVQAVAAYYQVDVQRLLVVVDDADLPLGHLRMRPDGGAGGHHGLESIERQLGTSGYARLRVGIGRLDGTREISGYVLGRFSSTEAGLLDKVLVSASDQAVCWLEHGIQKAMNRFNGAVTSPDNEGKAT